MPRTPSPLPPSLAGSRLFTTPEANALRVSRGRLRATDLDRPTWGVRRTRTVPSGPPRDRPPGPDGEYDGDHHRTDRRRWQYERERRAGLEDDGWRYVEFTSLTLTEPRRREALIARLRQWLGPAR